MGDVGEQPGPLQGRDSQLIQGSVLSWHGVRSPDPGTHVQRGRKEISNASVKTNQDIPKTTGQDAPKRALKRALPTLRSQMECA